MVEINQSKPIQTILVFATIKLGRKLFWFDLAFHAPHQPKEMLTLVIGHSLHCAFSMTPLKWMT